MHGESLCIYKQKTLYVYVYVYVYVSSACAIPGSDHCNTYKQLSSLQDATLLSSALPGTLCRLSSLPLVICTLVSPSLLLGTLHMLLTERVQVCSVVVSHEIVVKADVMQHNELVALRAHRSATSSRASTRPRQRPHPTAFSTGCGAM